MVAIHFGWCSAGTWLPWQGGRCAPCLLSALRARLQRGRASQEEHYQHQLTAEVRSELDLAHCRLGHGTPWTSVLHLAMTDFEMCL